MNENIENASELHPETSESSRFENDPADLGTPSVIPPESTRTEYPENEEDTF
jgi:hypothetical protein